MKASDSYNDVSNSYDSEVRDFGVPIWPKLLVIKKDDVFYFTRYGETIAELHPGNRRFLVIPKRTLATVGVRYAWTDLFHTASYTESFRNCIDGLRPRINREGIRTYSLNFGVLNENGKRSRKASATRRFEVFLPSDDNDYSWVFANADLENYTIQRDNIKYKQFCKSLIDIEKITAAKIRLNAFSDYPHNRYFKDKVNYLSNRLENSGMDIPDGIISWYNQKCRQSKAYSDWGDFHDRITKLLSAKIPSGAELDLVTLLAIEAGCYNTYRRNSWYFNVQDDPIRIIEFQLSWIKKAFKVYKEWYFREYCCTKQVSLA